MTPQSPATEDLSRLLLNPFHAITIHPDLALPHPPLISKERWVKANVKVATEMGLEAYLRTLLHVLEGGYVTPDQR